jgi:hypothetical protein
LSVARTSSDTDIALRRVLELRPMSQVPLEDLLEIVNDPW